VEVLKIKGNMNPNPNDLLTPEQLAFLKNLIVSNSNNGGAKVAKLLV